MSENQADFDLRQGMLRLQQERQVQQALRMKHIDLAAELFKNHVILENPETWSSSSVTCLQAAAEFMITAGLMQRGNSEGS